MCAMIASAAVYLDRYSGTGYRVQGTDFSICCNKTSTYVLCPMSMCELACLLFRAHRHIFAVCVFDCPSHGHVSVNESARYYWLPCALLQSCLFIETLGHTQACTGLHPQVVDMI